MIAKAMESLKKQMVSNAVKSSSLGGIPPYAKLMVDPLNAALVSRPDFNTTPTNQYRLVDVYDVTANSGGAFFAIFAAGLISSTYVAATMTNSVVTAFGGSVQSQYYTSLNTDNTLLRTLVFSVQWMPTANDNTSQGAVHIGLYPGAALSSSITLGDVSNYMDDTNGVMTSADQQAIAISRPHVPPSMSPFTSNFAANFPAIVFAASGLPLSTNVGKLVVTRIVECEPYTGGIPSMTAKRTCSDPLSVACGDNVMGSTASYAAGDKCYESVVKAGTAMAAASAADLANWTPSNPMSRLRKYM